MVIPQNALDQMTPRPAIDVTTLVVHHTVMPATADAYEVNIDDISSQGFAAIGYNAYVKCVDEARDEWIIQEGRPLEKRPAAQYGMNGPGYAIAIGGNYEPGAMEFLTPVSENALRLVAERAAHLKSVCPHLKYLIAHRDVAAIAVKTLGGVLGDYSTLCCGQTLYDRMHDLRVMTALAFPE